MPAPRRLPVSRARNPAGRLDACFRRRASAGLERAARIPGRRRSWALVVCELLFLPVSRLSRRRSDQDQVGRRQPADLREDQRSAGPARVSDPGQRHDARTPSVPPVAVGRRVRVAGRGHLSRRRRPGRARVHSAATWSRRSNWPPPGELGGNYKSLLQQFAQREIRPTPTYHLLDEKGPDHSKCFKIVGPDRPQPLPGRLGSQQKRSRAAGRPQRPVRTQKRSCTTLPTDASALDKRDSQSTDCKGAVAVKHRSSTARSTSLCLGALLLLAGCSQAVQPRVQTEATLRDQIAAVRAGTSDRIEVAQAALADEDLPGAVNRSFATASSASSSIEPSIWSASSALTGSCRRLTGAPESYRRHQERTAGSVLRPPGPRRPVWRGPGLRWR